MLGDGMNSNTFRTVFACSSTSYSYYHEEDEDDNDNSDEETNKDHHPKRHAVRYSHSLEQTEDDE
jgi:hypothetical protein